jgi:hypothetical protein
MSTHTQLHSTVFMLFSLVRFILSADRMPTDYRACGSGRAERRVAITAKQQPTEQQSNVNPLRAPAGDKAGMTQGLGF